MGDDPDATGPEPPDLDAVVGASGDETRRIAEPRDQIDDHDVRVDR